MTEVCLSVKNDCERNGFEKIYNTYKADVLRRTFALLRNHSDAEDAAQETWFCIAKNMNYICEKDATFVKAYIMKTAKCRAIDIMRRKQRTESKTVCFDDYDAEIHDGDADSVLTALCENEEIEMIADCINSLPENYSVVLSLYYGNGNSVKEIAKILTINPETAQKRLHRGRLMLVASMKERIGGN